MVTNVVVEMTGDTCSRIIQGINIRLYFVGEGGEIPIEVNDLSATREIEGDIKLDQRAYLAIVLAVYAAAIKNPGDFLSLVDDKLNEKTKKKNSVS